MIKGTVKLWNIDRGFGCLTHDDRGKDVSFMQQHCGEQDLRRRKKERGVEFETQMDVKGLKAVNVKVV
jgi:cold shock CspA family protein